jgi:hypothetical protein
MQSLRVSGETDNPKSPSKNLSFNSPSGTASPAVGTPKKTSQKEKQMSDQKRAKLLAEIKQVKPGEKIHMNMVIIGHVDAGKSTMMGHVLYQSGFVSKQVIDRHEHEAKQRGKSSFHFAWVLDQHEEERNRGVTIDVATSYLETPKYRVTLLDAPGHRDFVPSTLAWSLIFITPMSSPWKPRRHDYWNISSRLCYSCSASCSGRV